MEKTEMSKIKERIIGLSVASLMLLTSVSFSSCDFGASSQGSESNSGSASSIEDSSSGIGEEEGEVVDKSTLTYVASLDSYKKTDWSAKWIWSGSSSQKNVYTAFRKTFTLDEKPSTALADIAAENEYYLWVNGTLVVYDGGYKRGPTLYDTYYQEIDLADYLVKGENTIVALVCYYGRSGTASTTAGMAGFLFEMDCGAKKIISDASFKAQRLTAYKNDRLLKGDYPNYEQYEALADYCCYYDARDSVGDYTAPSFDDKDWSAATELCKVGVQPFNDTYLCVAPFFAYDKEQYLGKKFEEPTTIDIDMGTNRQFSPYFELESEKAGARITYYTDTYKTSGLGSFKDDYVTVAGKQSYESFPWRTGKHLIIEVPAGVKFTKIGVRYNGYDTQVVGSFSSSDETLDTLWQRAINTVKIDMRDTYMDCPERERSPWAGDVANMATQTLYALDENGYDLIKKTILCIVGWTQSGTGTDIDDCIPLRVPCMKVTEWPSQDLAFLNSVYEYYMHSGDEETVRLFYPIVRKYLALWGMDANGMPSYRVGGSTWADWGTGFTDEKLIQVCQYYIALKDGLALARRKIFLSMKIEFNP